jgi:SSS family solute:Na+ symporter
MTLAMTLPWLVLAGYCLLVLRMTPQTVSPAQFFGGADSQGKGPGLWLLVASAAITWIFAKSIANAANLAGAFGIIGGIGYALYYLSFLVAGIAIYLIRVKGGHRSLAEFLTSKYGGTCARLFLIAIAIRLFNEVWSNTKVAALYFGTEGSLDYWLGVGLVSAFTVYYSWRGGLRSSLLTDGAQMLLAAVLLVTVLAIVWPGLWTRGLPDIPASAQMAGLTFCGLALVQVLSYPFHDPVMTDRGFITEPKMMLKGFALAGLVAGAFILLFSTVGLYGRALGLTGNMAVAVPAALGLPVLLGFYLRQPAAVWHLNGRRHRPGDHRRHHHFRHHGDGAGADVPARLHPPGRPPQLSSGVLAGAGVRGRADPGKRAWGSGLPGLDRYRVGQICR